MIVVADRPTAPATVLTLDHFAPLVGQHFEVLADGERSIAAALVEAAPLGLPTAQGRAPFTLVFEAPASTLLSQRSYALLHPAFNSLQIFLVPVGRSPAGIRYEAVFN